MLPLDYVLAVAVLSAPPGAGEVPPDAAEFASLRGTLQAVALRRELLDPRELDQVLVRAEDFNADLRMLRRRHRDLSEAPPLADCLRFPDRRLAGELLEFNRAYHKHLTQRQAAGTGERAALEQALAETEQLYEIWDAVRDARSECYFVTARRQALLSLRAALGEHAYAAGTLPPHVPVWRFARAD
jgi:hypothetical protein